MKTPAMATVVALAAVVCAAVTVASAITTKPSGTAVIKTTLQISPTARDDKTAAAVEPEGRRPSHRTSFAARYWVSDNNTLYHYRIALAPYGLVEIYSSLFLRVRDTLCCFLFFRGYMKIILIADDCTFNRTRRVL